MGTEDQLSPEEKLLKVIQQGGVGSSARPVSPSAASPAGARPKLEVAGEEDVATMEPAARAAAVVPPRLPPKIRPPTRIPVQAAPPVAAATRPTMKTPAPALASASPAPVKAPIPVSRPAKPIPTPVRADVPAAAQPAASPTVVSSSNSEPASTAAPMAAPAAKPRLKVTPPAPAAAPKTVAPGVASTPARPTQKPIPTAGLIGGGPRPMIKKRRQSRTPLIAALNRGLGAAAVLLVLLTGWEIRAAMHRAGGAGGPDWLPGVGPEPVSVADGASEVAAGVAIDAVELARIQKLYEDRPLFVLASAKRAEGGLTTNVVAVVGGQTEWEAYARKNFKLKGLSALPTGEMEAIVSDNVSGKLQYLKANDRVLVDRRNVKVEAVEADSLVLSDGTRRVQIK